MPTDDWVSKMTHMHTTDFQSLKRKKKKFGYITTQMNFEVVMLREQC